MVLHPRAIGGAGCSAAQINEMLQQSTDETTPLITTGDPDDDVIRPVTDLVAVGGGKGVGLLVRCVRVPRSFACGTPHPFARPAVAERWAGGGAHAATMNSTTSDA